MTTKAKPYACCPRCGEPLVSTFEFRKVEWVCVACPATWDWLSARDGGDPTPEQDDRYLELRARYEQGRDKRHAEGTEGQWDVACSMMGEQP